MAASSLAGWKHYAIVQVRLSSSICDVLRLGVSAGPPVFPSIVTIDLGGVSLSVFFRTDNDHISSGYKKSAHSLRFEKSLCCLT